VNPALDLSTEVDKVESGYKLRCGPARYDPGGGGVNVSRAIAKLGGTSLPFVAIGGVTGQMLKSLLEGEGLDAVWFDLDGLTRQSLVVNEQSSGEQFRFVLPGPDWSEPQTGHMLTALEKAISDAPGRIDYIVASGSLPPGVPGDYYQQIGAIAERAGARLVLDTSGRAIDAAARGQYPPHIWIMDQGEAEFLAEHPIEDMDALENFARELHGRGLAGIIILSFAEGGAVAVSGSECVRIMPPKVDVVSKVGAGDSFVAGLVFKLAAGASLHDACVYAVAAAASAVTTPATELLDGAQTERYVATMMNEQR
jgi:6-phosphofructokinase 2